jgi:hypothetical protein
VQVVDALGRTSMLLHANIVFASRESSKVCRACVQVVDMLELIFPTHIVAMMQHGHRLLLESFDRVAVVGVEITGFRRLCAAMTMPAAVERVSGVLAMLDATLRDAGLDTLDVTQTTFWAFLPLECASFGFVLAFFDVLAGAVDRASF